MVLEEKRRYPRYEVSGVQGLLEGDRPADVIVLGLGGLLVVIDEEPEITGSISVEVELHGTTFSSQGQIVFIGPDWTAGESPARFRVGIAFENPSRDQQATLASYIHHSLG